MAGHEAYTFMLSWITYIQWTSTMQVTILRLFYSLKTGSHIYKFIETRSYNGYQNVSIMSWIFFPTLTITISCTFTPKF